MCVDATIPQKQADQNCQPEAESLFEVTFFTGELQYCSCVMVKRLVAL